MPKARTACDRGMCDHRLYDMDIAVGIADMQSLLVDADENVPKEEEAFQKVEHERGEGGL